MIAEKKSQKRSLETKEKVEEIIVKKSKREKNKNPVEIEIKGEKKKVLNLEITGEHVAQCITAILKLNEIHSKNQKALFAEESNPVLLQINSIKIPKVPYRQLRLSMPHKMVAENDEVALFVTDLERGRRKDSEPTTEHWENILRKAGVTRKIEIIPMNVVKNEYGQFETKRKLARMYDFFLVDGRITGHLTHILGKGFKRFAMPPVPIHASSSNLAKEIDTALTKTSLEIHGNGNCHTVKVALLSMTEREIQDNVMAALEQLKQSYPGGFDNIRSILIKTRQSLGIPIYYSMKNQNIVKTPNVSPKRPKAYDTVEGELTTLAGNVTVKVSPAGDVEVIKEFDENMETSKETELDGVESEDKKIKRKMKKTQVQSKKSSKINKSDTPINIKKKPSVNKTNKLIKGKATKLEKTVKSEKTKIDTKKGNVDSNNQKQSKVSKPIVKKSKPLVNKTKVKKTK